MTLAARLLEAETALHSLMTGQAAVRVQDSNGEAVTYTAANREALASYVALLRRQLAGRGVPHTILFRTSKGI
jgi:hypothetical protein